jgi:hypothetical protein
VPAIYFLIIDRKAFIRIGRFLSETPSVTFHDPDGSVQFLSTGRISTEERMRVLSRDYSSATPYISNGFSSSKCILRFSPYRKTPIAGLCFPKSLLQPDWIPGHQAQYYRFPSIINSVCQGIPASTSGHNTKGTKIAGRIKMNHIIRPRRIMHIGKYRVQN